MSSLMRTILCVLLSVLFVFSCNTATEQEPVAGDACANTSECGDGQLCLSEVCTDVGCTVSEDCAFQQYCDESFACVDGCGDSSDCIAGQECDVASNTCVDYGCRDSNLDCGYGEFCDTTTGECYPDERRHCGSCDVASTGNQCGQGSQCTAWLSGGECDGRNGGEEVFGVIIEWGNGDCAPGQHCDPFTHDQVATGIGYCHEDYCVVPCEISQEEACPRGFDCYDVFGDGSFDGCVGDCSYMLENGLGN